MMIPERRGNFIYWRKRRPFRIYNTLSFSGHIQDFTIATIPRNNITHDS